MKSKTFNPRNWLASRDTTERPATVTAVLEDARTHGNLLDNWRIRREIGRATVGLSKDAIDILFDKKREELKFRADLALDRAKKQAIAESLEATAEIEHQISRMTTEVKFTIDDMVNEARNTAYAKEAIRIRELKDAAEGGAILPERLERATQVVSDNTTDMVDRLQGMAGRLIENLGIRLGEALSLNNGNDGGV